MNNLFDNTEKLVKFNRSLSQQLHIKHVLNPYTQSLIDVKLANRLGILCNGYYRNRYGGLIPLHIAANEGLIEFTINGEIDCEEMEIEYHSKSYPIITNLLIRQVYDNINQCMITFREAIENDYLDTELFIYSCSNISMSIHEAFYRGLIIGEIRTNVTEETIYVNETHDIEYEDSISLLTNIINCLTEFINTINIIDECELTSDGYIKYKKSGECYLLTQAMELGLISFIDD